MKTLSTTATMIAVAAAALSGQVASDVQPPMPVSAVQRAFEAGQYAQALKLVAEARGRDEMAGPADTFLVAHIHLKRSQNDAAAGEFNRLIESGDDIWRQVGESSNAFITQNFEHALAVSTQAVAQINERNSQAGDQAPAPDPGARMRDFAAFYQLGIVKARLEDWSGAVEAFERAVTLNPSFAYAHYYAGLAHSRLRRPDQTAAHFEVFLKLAPMAPERGAVMSIMRTLRGA
jgi:tetratricopeptide (TPR) repeat protein